MGEERELSARKVIQAVPPGWAPLAGLAFVTARTGGGYVYDIKSKMAGMSVFAITSREAEDAIRTLEAASRFACEVCGRTAQRREHRHWYRTLCEAHWADIAGGTDWYKVYRAGRLSESELQALVKRVEREGELDRARPGERTPEAEEP